MTPGQKSFLRLTTLAHPINDLAKTAVGLLLKRLNEVSHPKKENW
jgi:DNA-binding LacI/PurR family transcriptional regulator